jgi:ABC-type transporter Mla subunit MlaD
MLKRLIPLAGMLTLATTLFAVSPASAQTPSDPPLGQVVQTLNGVLDQAQPAFDALQPATDQLTPALKQAIDQLQPILTQLNGIIDQGKAACSVLGPVLDAAKPVIAQAQPLLDEVANPPEQLAFLSPVLTQVSTLADKVLELCEPVAAATETPRGAPAAASAPASLPHTGGPLLAVPALGALGLGGALRALRKRIAD